MTQAVIKLVKGARTLDLMTAPYSAGTDFRPPATDYTLGLSEGSSANITGGAQVYARKYVNKTFSFQVKISSTSDGGVNEALRTLGAFLALAGDDEEPLYLHYKSNSDTPEPLWGQYGANYRHEIVDGSIAELWDRYGETRLRAHTVFATVNLMIKPFAIGKQQKAATATGGILEDVIGKTDGRALGIYLAEATVNNFSNPVLFAPSSSPAWDTGWTAGASITAACNTQTNYVLSGTMNSAYLTSSASTVNTYTQQVNMGTTCWVTISCYAKLADSGSIGASHLALYYGSTGSRATTYASAGGGWYRLTASSLTGLNAACATGVVVMKNKSVYVGGFQIEQKAYATPLAWGDLLGVTWASTAHNSTSTRTVSSCKIPIDNTIVTAGQGSIRMIVKFDQAAGRGATQVLADLRDASHTTAPYLYYNASDTKFYLSSNAAAETSTTSAQTVSGATFILHATWGTAGLSLYLNGGTPATTGTYTANALGASLFVGTDYSAANPLAGTIAGFATFDRALTAAEVANDYATIAPIVARGQRVESLPYFYTDDGDNVLSLDTGKTPLGIVGGISGNVPAVTEIMGQLSSNFSTVGSIALSNFSRGIYLPLRTFLSDQSGSALAGDYGSEHYSACISGSNQRMSDTNVPIIVQSNFINQFQHAEIATLARLKSSASGTGYIYSAYFCGGNYYSDARTITLQTDYRAFLGKSLDVMVLGGFDSISSRYLVFESFAGTASGSPTFSIDYFAILPRPLMTLSSTVNAGYFVFKGHRAFAVNNPVLPTISLPISLTGDLIEFEPNRYNHVQLYFCTDGTIDPLTTYQATLLAIYVTPRWKLL